MSTSPGSAPVPSTAALVTGCSSGIGRAVAERLHAAGFPVYATARRPESIAPLAGAGMTTLALDVTDESSMVAAVDRVVTDHGAVGVLVNNAGYSLQGTVERTPMGDVRREFETNLFGLVRLTQLVLPGMREQRYGRVVNMGSMGGRFTFPGAGFYHATKHGVEAISDALRLEVAPFGVKVVLIEPGPVQSRFGETAVSTIPEGDDSPYARFHDEMGEAYARAYRGRPTDLVVSPEAVADVVVKAVRDPSPRPRYAVGVAARTLITSRRLLPDQAWDMVMRRIWPTPKAGPG